MVKSEKKLYQVEATQSDILDSYYNDKTTDQELKPIGENNSSQEDGSVTAPFDAQTML